MQKYKVTVYSLKKGTAIMDRTVYARDISVSGFTITLVDDKNRVILVVPAKSSTIELIA